MDRALTIVLAALCCPRCSGHDWAVPSPDADTVRCRACGWAATVADGIVHVEHTEQVAEVNEERVAVVVTEDAPELGGWRERYVGRTGTDPSLQRAYLSLPYDDGSPRFREPGYFQNVLRCAEEFDLLCRYLPRGGTLLDLGADGTWSTARLASRGFEAIAVDITDHLVLGELYQTASPAYGRVNVDMHAPVFRARHFDVVTAINALHHSKHLDLLAQRIATVLKPGGVLACLEPYVQNEAQARHFGVDQSGVGINENIHTVRRWNEAFEHAGLALQVFALSDSFNAVYQRLDRPAAPSPLLATDRDGCYLRFYDAVLTAAGPTTTGCGEPACFEVRIANHGTAAWASRGPYPVRLSCHVFRLHPDRRESVCADGPRVELTSFVAPGDTVALPLTLTFDTPGRYAIEFDLVEEGRTWFADRGGRTATAVCHVAPEPA